MDFFSVAGYQLPVVRCNLVVEIVFILGALIDIVIEVQVHPVLFGQGITLGEAVLSIGPFDSTV